MSFGTCVEYFQKNIKNSPTFAAKHTLKRFYNPLIVNEKYLF